ncbi:probable G-protein coupled receptor Mth-like 3 isoform X2 [Fopius arisanus]|uniref:Probable G-protein coupled receptor Mth-like 3 isoform X2 n=2 Tax=Fopius arisanus TaxID=64838 RepID=A0A9R1U361_9HYME|nr:PREDICTED: probable G-protein coupled receptor Mth-like 3 isoform X2 [Fopius arisanus]
MWIPGFFLMILSISWGEGVDGGDTRTISNHDDVHQHPITWISRMRRSLSPRRKPNIAICCSPGYFMSDSTSMNCSSKTSKPIYDVEIPQIYRKDLKPSEKKPDIFERIYRMPCENHFYELSSDSDTLEAFYLLEDGRVFVDLSEEEMPDEYMGIDDYCFASWMGDNGTRTILITCHAPYEMQDFPLLNIHGMILMSYVFSLFWAYGGITVMRLKIISIDKYSRFCTFLGFFNYLWFMSSFFWLNALCFDIWLTFRSARSMEGSIKRRTERRKFIFYTIYAWGCPSILTIICLILDFSPSMMDSIFSPRFGEYSCWFQGDVSESLYLYCPMALTVICNVSLFISTTIKILRHKRETANQLERNDSHRHEDKQWFNLYLKLFVIMGITWSMDVVGWLLGSQSIWLRYITDGIASVEGVLIFIIFVCKDKIRRHLMKRFNCQQSNTTS